MPPSLRRMGRSLAFAVLALGGMLLVLAPGGGVRGILRGDDTQKLSDELNRYRGKLETLQEGTQEHTEARLHYHALQHKIRAMDFFDHGMTQAEYDDFAALVDRQEQLEARHGRDDFDELERKEFAEVHRKVKEVTQRYKDIKKDKRRDPEMEAERQKIRVIREKIHATDDRDELEVLRNQLNEVYQAKPKLTAFGEQRWKVIDEERRANRRKRGGRPSSRNEARRQRKRQGLEGRFPRMDEERLARVEELREQIAGTEDRDELLRLRQALKFERDEAAAEEKTKRQRGGGVSRSAREAAKATSR